MCVGFCAGVTYLRYTVLTSPKKDETAVHCCDPALSVIVMFGVLKRLSLSICLAVYCLIRSLVDPTLLAFIVCDSLQPQPSFRLLPSTVSYHVQNQMLGKSRKLGGAAEHLIDGNEKRIGRLSFEF